MKTIQKLLVPTDLSKNSRRGLLDACSLAMENKGVVTILHVANEFDAWELYTDETRSSRDHHETSLAIRSSSFRSQPRPQPFPGTAS